MEMKMPALFVGHGSPMIALEHNALTDGLRQMGERIVRDYGRPKAILAISAHWTTHGHRVQRTETPRQVFDMYGFPRALYEVIYTPRGCAALSDAVLATEGIDAQVDNLWGIDHGTWTPLVHLFPDHSIPIVQLSVNADLTARECYEAGLLLAPLREQGYLVIGSGNVVHNLCRVDWDNPNGSPETMAFDNYIKEHVTTRDDDAVIRYDSHPHALYAVPTPEHYLPLLYVLGATQGEPPTVFNADCNLGAIAMTSYAFLPAPTTI